MTKTITIAQELRTSQSATYELPEWFDEKTHELEWCSGSLVILDENGDEAFRTDDFEWSSHDDCWDIEDTSIDFC